MTIDELLVDIRQSSSWCSCHGDLRQVDAKLVTNGTPVRIMKSSAGYHVVFGTLMSVNEMSCPEPISSLELEKRIRRAL